MSAKEFVRCSWPGSDPLYLAYHDEEWGVPLHDSRALWEMLMLEGFQAGLAWIVILRKREAFRKAFRGFDPAKVARFTAKDIERLLADPGIVRSRAKIEATIRFCSSRSITCVLSAAMKSIRPRSQSPAKSFALEHIRCRPV